MTRSVCGHRSYHIDGMTYDKRLLEEETPLLRELLVSLGVSAGTVSSKGGEEGAGGRQGYIATQLRPGLSSIAYKQLLFEIATFIAMEMVSALTEEEEEEEDGRRTWFSEWGALLFQTQV